MFGKSLQALQRKSLETQLKQQKDLLEALRSEVQERNALSELKDQISQNNDEITKLSIMLGLSV